MIEQFNVLTLIKSQFAEELKKADHSSSINIVNGWFSNEIVFDFLIDALRPTTIIEVGTFTGNSACYMHKRLFRHRKEFELFCVDTFCGSQEHWLNNGYLQKLSFSQARPDFYQEFLKRARLTDSKNLIPICLPSVTAASVLQKLNKFAKLIYIDGAHEYQDVLNDLTAYFPLLSQDGIMLGDDYHYAPTRRAVQEFGNQHQLDLYVHMNKKYILLKSMNNFQGNIQGFSNIFCKIVL